MSYKRILFKYTLKMLENYRDKTLILQLLLRTGDKIMIFNIG